MISVLFLLAFVKVKAWDASDRESLKDYAIYVSSREGVSVQTTLSVLACESGFNPSAWNKNDPNGGSKNVAQFQDKTFYGYAEKYNIYSPDIWNPFQQINLLVYMLKDDLGYHWSCYKMINA